MLLKCRVSAKPFAHGTLAGFLNILLVWDILLVSHGARALNKPVQLCGATATPPCLAVPGMRLMRRSRCALVCAEGEGCNADLRTIAGSPEIRHFAVQHGKLA